MDPALCRGIMSGTDAKANNTVPMPVISKAVFHFARRVTGRDTGRADRSQVMNTSRPTMASVGIRMTHHHAKTWQSPTKLIATRSLSAIGSSQAPNSETALSFLAAKPSMKSVAATKTKSKNGKTTTASSYSLGAMNKSTIDGAPDSGVKIFCNICDLNSSNLATL